MTDERKPFWAKCKMCAHCWPVCYVPMEMRHAARLMKAARCPSCDATGKQIGVAKQDDGKLLEDSGQSGARDPLGATK